MRSWSGRASIPAASPPRPLAASRPHDEDVVRRGRVPGGLYGDVDLRREHARRDPDQHVRERGGPVRGPVVPVRLRGSEARPVRPPGAPTAPAGPRTSPFEKVAAPAAAPASPSVFVVPCPTRLSQPHAPAITFPFPSK